MDILESWTTDTWTSWEKTLKTEKNWHKNVQQGHLTMEIQESQTTDIYSRTKDTEDSKAFKNVK